MPLSLGSLLSVQALLCPQLNCLHQWKNEAGCTRDLFKASQDSLEISDASGHTSLLESEDDMKLGMVVRPSNRATRRVSPPQGTRKTNFYRCVSFRKASTHQPTGNEGGFSGFAILQNGLQKQPSPQHLSVGIHQQTGRHTIGRTLCPDVEDFYTVPSKQCGTQIKAQTGFTQCYSTRSLQEELDPINRVVPLSTDLQTNIQTFGESPSGLICNQPEHRTPSLCFSDSRSSGLGSRCRQHPVEKSGCLHFFSYRPAAKGCTKTSIANMQDNSHRPRLADKTVVLGPGGDVSGHTKTTTTHTHSAKTATEQPIPYQPSFPESPCLVSRSSTLQECGFTGEVAERIAAPQRLSTRAIYNSKRPVFQR